MQSNENCNLFLGSFAHRVRAEIWGFLFLVMFLSKPETKQIGIAKISYLSKLVIYQKIRNILCQYILVCVGHMISTWTETPSVFRGHESTWVTAVGGYGGTDDLSHFVNTHFSWRSCYIHQILTVYSLKKVEMPKQTPQKRNERKWSSLWNRIRQFCCVWQVPNPLRPVDPQQIFWWVMLFDFVLSLFAAISCSIF